jgi:hypothetical protein
MPTTRDPAGWVAVEPGRDRTRVVWGVGTTPAAAIADATDAPEGLVALPASARLLAWLPEAAEPIARIDADRAWHPEEQSDRERAEAQADAAAADARIPDAARPWADHRRRMIRRMVLAAIAGHPAVRLSGRGQPVWTAAAALRTEPDGKGEAQLAQHLDDALDEMTQNLGDDTVRRIVETERSNARLHRLDRLAQTAEAIFGPEWVSPLSRQAEVGIRTAQRWAAREADPRDVDQVIGTLQPLARQRAQQLRAWLAVLEREFGV